MLLHGNLTQFGNVLCGAYKGAKAETSISMQRIVWSGNKLTEENTGRSIATVKEKGSFKKRELVTNTVKCKELNPFGVYELRVIRRKSPIMARNSSNTQVWNKC